MTRKGLLTIFGIISLTGFLVHCGQEDTAFTSQDASAFAGKVAGRVVDKNGAAVPGALVTASPGGVTTASLADGSYELSGLSAGKYRLSYSKADYRDTIRPDSVPLGLLQTDSLGASPLHYRYATVKGTIVDRSGAALPTAGVVVENQSASTSAVSQGSFMLARVEPGSVRLFAAYTGAGYGYKDVMLVADTILDVGMVRLDHMGGTVSGTVTDSVGHAISNALVTAAGGGLKTTSKSDGSYTLTNVPTTTTVVVDAGSSGKTAVTGVSVLEGGSTSLPAVSVAPTASASANALPTLLPGLALGTTTDKELLLQVQGSLGTDSTWQVLRYLWSVDGGATWIDSTTSGTWHLQPTMLPGWNQGTTGKYFVTVRARVYKAIGATVQDSVTAKARITVQLTAPPDRTPPTITRVSPSSDTTMAWKDSVVTVVWKVADDRRLGTVLVDGDTVAFEGGLVSRQYMLGLGRTTARIVARDSAGNVAQDSLVLVRKAAIAHDSTLSSLSVVSPSGSKLSGFSPKVLSYVDSVASTDTSVTVAAVASDSLSKVKINGSASTTVRLLDTGATNVRIVVKATDGDSLAYVVNVVRKSSNSTGASASGTFTDAHDGQTYKWVTIGTQTWMAQNLNYAGTTGSTGVCYNNLSSNCATYGRLYTWAEVMNGSGSSTANPSGVQGICPSGWHVPSDTEWSTLVQYVDSATSGTKLKSTSGWSSGNGTDTYGFNVLPAGYRGYGKTFGDLGDTAYFWTSSEDASSFALNRIVYYDNAYVRRFNDYKSYSSSLRCVQGAGTNISSDTLTTLHSFALDSGTLTATFDSSITSYVDSVASTVKSLKVTATASSSSAVVKINGTIVSSGTATSVGVSTDTMITIVMSNPNTLSTKTYTVRVMHKAAVTHDSTLASLSIVSTSGVKLSGFSSSVLSYTDTVASTDTSVTVSAVASDSLSKVTVNGSALGRLRLSDTGNTTSIRIVVKASDGDSLTYAVTVVKKAATDTLLKSLTVKAGALTPAFAPTVRSYTDTVASSATSETITASASSSNATVYGAGILDLSGVSAGSSLSDTIAVTNGTKSLEYIVRIVKRADTSTLLHSLRLTVGALTPAFDSNTLNYVDTVSSTVTSIEVIYQAKSTSDSVQLGYRNSSNLFYRGYADTVIIPISTDTTVTLNVRNSAGSSTGRSYAIRFVHSKPLYTTGTLFDSRDNQTYKTVTIGTQTWMAQNLNYKRSGSDSGWCYSSDTSNCSKYGRLYTWAEAMDTSSRYDSVLLSPTLPHQGICPSGWHVPSDAEWSTLVQYVDSATSGTKLKANSSFWSTNTGTDVYGFSVLPAGYRFYDGSFDRLGNNANFWSSSEYDASNAWYRYFNNGVAYVYRGNYYKSHGFSLRCLQN